MKKRPILMTSVIAALSTSSMALAANEPGTPMASPPPPGVVLKEMQDNHYGERNDFIQAQEHTLARLHQRQERLQDMEVCVTMARDMEHLRHCRHEMHDHPRPGENHQNPAMKQPSA